MFSIPQKSISEMINIAAKIIQGNSPVQAANCAKLMFGKGFSISTMNFEQFITLSTKDFDAEESNTSIIPCKTFQSIISALNNDADVGLSATAKRLTMNANSSKYNFGSIDAGEWPDLPWKENKKPFVIKASELLHAFEFTFPVCAADSMRHYLNGIHLSVLNKKHLRFIAMDGHQMAHYIAEVANVDLPEHGIVLPRTLVSSCVDMLNKVGGDTDVSINISEGKCRIRFTDEFNVDIISRLIDGEYPPIDRLIPYEREHILNTLPRSETVNALRRIDIIARDDDKRSPSVGIEVDKNVVCMKGKGREVSASDAQEQISLTSSNKMKINVSTRLLMSILSSYSGSHISLMTDPTSEMDAAILIADPGDPVTSETQRFSVLMPLRG